MRKIILASASPRRRELMKHITDEFSIVVSECDEVKDGLPPEDIVKKNALLKASSVFADNGDAVVIGADTIVVKDGRILGKPADRDEAEYFLKLLSGGTHEVMTGVCVLAEGIEDIFAEITKVTFADLTDAEIGHCLDSESFLDKAGSYAIQGAMARHITGIEGCYYNVIGLPVARLYSEMKKHDLL